MNADQHVGPEIVPGRTGAGRVSLAALQERIVSQLGEELAGRVGIDREVGDEPAQRALCREAIAYVLAVEAVRLTVDERHALVTAVYREVFGFGPLDALIRDDTVTELTVESADRVFVRREAGELQRVADQFQDGGHLRRGVARLLAAADSPPEADETVLELGLVVHGRPARLNAVLAPLSPVPRLSLRLHPDAPVTLDALARRGMLGSRGHALLRALASSAYGLLITGEAGTGKTVLLEALLRALSGTASGVLVERAVEIRPPEGIVRLERGLAFSAGIAAALEGQPAGLAMDEIRGDEALQLVAALASKARLLIVLRSSPAPERLSSALRMILRRGQPELAPDDIDHWLVHRLPFVVALRRAGGGLRLNGISQWQLQPGGLRLVPLLDAEDRLLAQLPPDLALLAECDAGSEQGNG